MRALWIGIILAALLCGTAWADPWPNYSSQSGNTITGVSVTVNPSVTLGGVSTWYITIADDAQINLGGTWYPITGVCGLGVYPNAGDAYAGAVTFGDAYGDWRLEPMSGDGTTGSNGFGWSGPMSPIGTPSSGDTGPIAIGTATFTGVAPPDLQYLLHVYATIDGVSGTYWGDPGAVPPVPPGVPEPASLALLASGLAGVVAVRKRKTSA